MINEVDYNAALATIDYLKEQVQLYQDQLKKKDTYYSIKVKDNYWVYGSEKAVQAVQDVLFENLRLKGYEDV
jgi:hypothetical protein